MSGAVGGVNEMVDTRASDEMSNGKDVLAGWRSVWMIERGDRRRVGPVASPHDASERGLVRQNHNDDNNTVIDQSADTPKKPLQFFSKPLHQAATLMKNVPFATQHEAEKQWGQYQKKKKKSLQVCSVETPTHPGIVEGRPWALTTSWRLTDRTALDCRTVDREAVCWHGILPRASKGERTGQHTSSCCSSSWW